MALNETKFYKALEDIFVGAPIEGEGGYVNLLSIKQKYYGNVVERLRDDISHDPVITDSFKEDFYNLLYTFFEKYFSECGSVCFAKTADWQRVYEKIYTDTKDVVLFWKTHMLYYVKSDLLFRSTYVKSKSSQDDAQYVFFFDVGDLQLKQNNEKKELVFAYKETRIGQIADVHDATTGDKTFVLSVRYSERNRKTDMDALVANTGLEQEVIEKAIGAFKKQTTVDFFIGKNAKAFLEEQLDIFLHQLLLEDENQFEQERLNQIKAVKKYAKNLIAFISQFENELVRIWTKPKFVKNANYVISLDTLDTSIVEKIRVHSGLDAQIEEWRALGIVGGGFSFAEQEVAKHPHLPVDTKYFKDLELDILAQFDNLASALSGVLIHSENFQALNTIKSRYQKAVKCIYIDPPFNTGRDFVYMDEYQDSTWLSIMSDRIDLAQSMLAPQGSMFLHLDHFAEHRGRELMDIHFGKSNFINNLAWSYRSGGASDSKALPYKHDSILYYAKDKQQFSLSPITERQYYAKRFMGTKKDKAGRYYSDTLLRDVFEGEIFDPKKKITFNVRKVLNLSNEFYSFSNSQKPEGLLHALFSMSNVTANDIVLDFFAGSGTSLVTALKLGAKFVGVEMGEHFNNTYPDRISYDNTPKNKKEVYEKFDVVELKEDGKKLNALVNKVGLLGRMKEAIACAGRHEPCGISDGLDWTGGGFVKYYELEQYEDVLNKAVYSADNACAHANDLFAQYVFFADKKLTDVYRVNGQEVCLDFNRLYENIDLPETISLLYGAPIERITADEVKLADISQPIKYNVGKMNDDEKIAFVKLLKPLLWWGE